MCHNYMTCAFRLEWFEYYPRGSGGIHAVHPSSLLAHGWAQVCGTQTQAGVPHCGWNTFPDQVSYILLTVGPASNNLHALLTELRTS